MALNAVDAGEHKEELIVEVPRSQAPNGLQEGQVVQLSNGMQVGALPPLPVGQPDIAGAFSQDRLWCKTEAASRQSALFGVPAALHVLAR